METIKNTPEKLLLRLTISDSLANALRRSVSEVPTLAVDEVEIFKNDSALYDEMLSLRVGLVPLKMEKGMNSKTKVELKLSKIGPATVYSGDLEGQAEVVHPNIPLTILGKDQKIELLAHAVLGKGTDHAKYIPGLAYYRHILEVKSSPQIDKIIESSKGAIKAEKKSGKWICDLTESEFKEVLDLDESAISDTEEMLFFVESYGNMPAKDILIKAIETLNENIEEFKEAIK